MSKLRLRVGIISARELAIADKSGASDPYAVVRVNGKKYKTKVIEQSINPEWDYEFEIPMHSSKLPALFCITVWDKDTFGRDFLGEVTIPFKNIFDRNAGGVSDGVPRHYKDPDNRSSWYGLSKRSEKNNVSGDIQIKFGFMEDHVRDNHQYITAWQSLTS